MWRATIKGLLAHKLRLALTALAIVLGVTFVSGTLVLTDTLRRRSRPCSATSTRTSTSRSGPRPASLATSARERGAQADPGVAARHGAAVPGVQLAVGGVGGYAQFVAPDGKAIANGGAPTLGSSFDPNPQLSALHLVAGGAPRAPTTSSWTRARPEVPLRRGPDACASCWPGRPQTFTISGIVRFGTANNLAGATLAAFDLPTAQKLFGEVGQFDDIDVLATSGADKAAVQAAIAASCRRGSRSSPGRPWPTSRRTHRPGAVVLLDCAARVRLHLAVRRRRSRSSTPSRSSSASGPVSWRCCDRRRQPPADLPLGAGRGGDRRAGVVARRPRARGAGRRRPRGAAEGLRHRPAVGAARVQPRTVVVGAARRGRGDRGLRHQPGAASRADPPVAALADYRGEDERVSRRRIVVGGVSLLLGAAAAGGGLTGRHIQLVGVGAVAIFIGVGMLAPVVARPMVERASGARWPGRSGSRGGSGRENSMRSPRRTAQTASALMVGLALVSTMAVFGASLGKSATSAVNNAISANYIITPSGNGEGRRSAPPWPRGGRVPG